MSVGGARNAVETVGELDGHYDGVIGAARAETSPNIAVRWASIVLSWYWIRRSTSRPPLGSEPQGFKKDQIKI